MAEIAQAHDGSLGMAHAFIDAVARTGADAIKFQTHLAADESTLAEPWRVTFSRQDRTRYDYWKRMEFSEEYWLGLRHHADAAGLKFLSSPFSLKAVQLLARVGVYAWKIASGEVNNEPMFQAMTRTGLPIILSTGMSAWAEIDAAVERIKSFGSELTVLQCTSQYPCPPEKLGLNVISQLRKRYRCAVGLSDHSGTIYAGLAAAVLSVDMIEVHVTFSREMFGPDVCSSVTISELKQLVEGVRFIERAQANPVEKDKLAADASELRRMFGKSVVAARDLQVGCVLTADLLAFKKPGTGLPPDSLDTLVGRRLRRSLCKDEQVLHDDLD